MINLVGFTSLKVKLAFTILSFVLYGISAFGIFSGDLKIAVDTLVLAVGSASALFLIKDSKSKEAKIKTEFISA